MKDGNPCYQCTERHAHCHSGCPEREEWLRKRAAEAAVRKEQERVERDIEVTKKSYRRKRT